MPTMTKKQILERAKKEKVSFINMQFVDVLGIVKAITIPITKLEDAIDSNVWIDGSSIEGFMRIFESDMFLKPDLDTFAIIPWTRENGGTTARIICDVHLADGTPFKGDPRYILKQQVAKVEKKGYKFYTGPELEFFLFRKDEDGNVVALRHDHAGYFDQSTDIAGEVRKEMAEALMAMGIDVEALHHEVANGQHEIDFKYGEAVKTADNAVTFRYVLKAIAHKHGLHATFMPKPIFGISGSGMHVHQSLFKNGQNAFYDEKDSYNLSALAKSYIAGQLKYVREIQLLLNPLVNSYKRLVVGYEAPVYIAWATTNRSALVRIPRFTKAKKSAARCELRNPDPAANPYLAFAGMLAIGMKGIEEKLTPPKSVEENIYHFTEETVKEKNIKQLAPNLQAAIEEFEKSKIAKEVVGEHTFNNLLRTKKAEWDEYRMRVSGWERDNYLEVY